MEYLINISESAKEFKQLKTVRAAATGLARHRCPLIPLGLCWAGPDYSPVAAVQIVLHVHTANDKALAFYARHGFTIVGRCERPSANERYGRPPIASVAPSSRCSHGCVPVPAGAFRMENYYQNLDPSDCHILHR